MTTCSIPLAICLILAPAMLQLFGRQLHWLLLSVATVYLVAGLQLSVSSLGTPIELNTQSNDTYYIIARGNYLIQTGTIVVLIGLATVPILKIGALKKIRTTTFVFWFWNLATTVHLTLLPWLFARFGMPRRYIEYEEAFRTYNLVLTWSAQIALVAGGALVALLGWSLFAHLTQRRRTPPG